MFAYDSGKKSMLGYEVVDLCASFLWGEGEGGVFGKSGDGNAQFQGIEIGLRISEGALQ